MKNLVMAIVVACVLNAIGRMQISYGQNIKRSAPTPLRVPCLFHTGSGLVSLSFHWSTWAPPFGSCTDVFLSAKAERPVKTRQVCCRMLPSALLKFRAIKQAA